MEDLVKLTKELLEKDFTLIKKGKKIYITEYVDEKATNHFEFNL